MTPNSKALIKNAVQQNALYRKSGMQERLFTHWFNGFVYNQIWEDPRVDLNALEVDSNCRIVTIGSGGCNVLNYLTRNPRAIDVVDLNPCHMYLTRLKIAALKGLPSYEDFFRFFAVAKGKQNVDNYYKYVREHLDDHAREFWEGGSLIRKLFLGARINYFEKYFYNYSRSGYFIRFVHAFSRLVKADLSRVLTAKSMEEQVRLYEQCISPAFDNWIVRRLAKLPCTVFSLGIPPQQFEEMKKQGEDGIVETFRERVRRLACNFPISENWFAWQVFGLRYDVNSQQALPDYLRKENYDQIKQNVSRVTTYIGSVTEYLRQLEDDSIDCFVLLDSQDWMSAEQLNDLWTQIERVGTPRARIIFRTAGHLSPIESQLTSQLRSHFIYEKEHSCEFYEQDRSAVYGGFHLYRMAV